MRTSKSKSRKPRPRTRATAKSGVSAKRRLRPATAGVNRKHASRTQTHSRLRSIDGRHPLQKAVPSAVVPYPAKRRRDSEIAFFNFDLARTIGLLPRSHPDKLDASLRQALLDTFSLVIVNEWDEAHGNQPRARDRQTHAYMATRYLQLQHPDE